MNSIYRYFDIYKKYLKDHKGVDVSFPGIKFKHD